MAATAPRIRAIGLWRPLAPLDGAEVEAAVDEVLDALELEVDEDEADAEADADALEAEAEALEADAEADDEPVAEAVAEETLKVPVPPETAKGP